MNMIYEKPSIKKSTSPFMFLLPCIILLVCTISATAGTPTVVDSDGNVYGTVKIGDQVWLAQNMRVKTPKGSWCYREKEDNCKKYGALYSWAAAMALPDKCNQDDCYDLIKQPHQGICPKGFHVPSKEEFLKLFDAVGGKNIAGKKLKSRTDWWSHPGEDYFGFSAFPGGYRDNRYRDVDSIARFWTSFQENSECISKNNSFTFTCNNESGWIIDKKFAFSYLLGNGIDGSLGENLNKKMGNSLRCVEDDSLIEADEHIEAEFDSINNVLKDLRDGHSYKTVKIGSQIWMAQNLNKKTLDASWCYDEDEKNCDKYGRLYYWQDAMDIPDCCYHYDCKIINEDKHQGICPEGWRMPSDKDFYKLFDYVGGMGVAGKKLKSAYGWKEARVSTKSTGLWSTTEDGNDASAWLFRQGKDSVVHKELPKISGFSIRCIKDM